MAIRRVTGAVSPSELIFADANALGATYDGSGTTIERGETFTLPAGGTTAVSNGALRLEALKGDCTITNNGNSTLTNASGVDGTIIMRSGASDFPAFVRNSSMGPMSTPAREDFTGSLTNSLGTFSGTVNGTINSDATFPAGHILQTKIKQITAVTSIASASSQIIYNGDSDTALQMSALGVNSYYLMSIYCTVLGIHNDPGGSSDNADDSDLGVRVQYKKGSGSYTEYPSTASHSHRFNGASDWNTNVNYFSSDGYSVRLTDNAWGSAQFSQAHGEAITSAISDVLKWKITISSAQSALYWNAAQASQASNLGHTTIILQEIKQ